MGLALWYIGHVCLLKASIMSWTDLGLIFRVDRLSEWAQSHAYVPTALDLGDRIRVYVAFWDADKHGRVHRRGR